EAEGSDESSSSTATATATTTAAPSSNGSSNGTDTGSDRIFASPLARKIASERGIDLASVSGSGPSGRVVKKDVEQAAPGQAAASAPATAPQAAAPAPMPISTELENRNVPLSNMR